MYRTLAPILTITLLMISGLLWLMTGNFTVWDSTAYQAGVTYAQQNPSPELKLECQEVARYSSSPVSFISGCYVVLGDWS